MSAPNQPQGPDKLTIALYLLLAFIPIAVLAEYLHWGAGFVFITSMLAIVPLATAPENLSGRRSSSNRSMCLPPS